MAFKHVSAKLKELGLKITPQRQEVLHLLFEGGLFSADEIWQRVKVKYSAISLDTIYRTLNLLSDVGIVRKVYFEDGITRFECCKEEHHHYLVCRECGRVERIPCHLDKCISDIEHKCSWFTVADHEFILYGHCVSCES